MVNGSRASSVGAREPAESRLSHLEALLHQRSRSRDHAKAGDPDERHGDFDRVPFTLVLGSTSEIANLDALRLPVLHRVPHQGLVRSKDLVAAPTCAAPEVHPTVQGGEDPRRDALAFRIARAKKQKAPG